LGKPLHSHLPACAGALPRTAVLSAWPLPRASPRLHRRQSHHVCLGSLSSASLTSYTVTTLEILTLRHRLPVLFSRPRGCFATVYHSPRFDFVQSARRTASQSRVLTRDKSRRGRQSSSDFSSLSDSSGRLSIKRQTADMTFRSKLTRHFGSDRVSGQSSELGVARRGSPPFRHPTFDEGVSSVAEGTSIRAGQ